MKTTTTLQITLEALDVRKACQEYMVKHGISGANGLKLEFAKAGKDVTATLLVELQDESEPTDPVDDTPVAKEDPVEATEDPVADVDTSDPEPVTKSSPLFSS